MHEFNDVLVKACAGCAINETKFPVADHNKHQPGWPCGTCFYNVSDTFEKKHWQTLIWYGYNQMLKDDGLTELPASAAEREAVLKHIYAKACERCTFGYVRNSESESESESQSECDDE